MSHLIICSVRHSVNIDILCLDAVHRKGFSCSHCREPDALKLSHSHIFCKGYVLVFIRHLSLIRHKIELHRMGTALRKFEIHIKRLSENCSLP